MAKGKGKGKGKGKDGAGSGADGGELSSAQQITLLKKESEALRLQLTSQHKLNLSTCLEKEEMKKEVKQLRTSFEAKGTETYELARNMTRQYKALQKELNDRIEALEIEKQAVESALEEEKTERVQECKEFQRVVETKEQEIRDQKEKIEELAQEFGDMLKETLEKLNERIEIHSDEWNQTDIEKVKERLSTQFGSAQ